MCMLTVFPLPELLDGRTTIRLYNGAYFNDDGHGWAVISEGRILTGHHLSADDAIESFADAYAKATGPAIFHSRWKTHGPANLANVHPFPVVGMPDTYVAHNGILPMDAYPEDGDDRSDTRLFADEIMAPRYGRLDSAKVRGRLDSWLGGNKIAVLTTNRRLRRNLYVFGLKLGEWVDGVWYSNGDHEGNKWRYSGTGWASTGTGTLSEDDDPCEWCGEIGHVNDAGVCEICGTCQDCCEPYRNCQCYTPKYLGGASDRPAVLGPRPDTADILAPPAPVMAGIRAQLAAVKP